MRGWAWLRGLLAGRGLLSDAERHRRAADRLDAALREMLKP